jgi:hypothetical protein
MRGLPFTQDEITLCTYAAIYDEQDFGGISSICRLTSGSRSSVDMKIRNIVAMLDEEGISRYNNYPGLSGRSTGNSARRTNWDWVQPLTTLTRDGLLSQCKKVLA